MRRRTLDRRSDRWTLEQLSKGCIAAFVPVPVLDALGRRRPTFATRSSAKLKSIGARARLAAHALVQPGLLQKVVAVGGLDGDALQRAVAHDGQRNRAAGGADRPDAAEGGGEIGEPRTPDLDAQSARL